MHHSTCDPKVDSPKVTFTEVPVVKKSGNQDKEAREIRHKIATKDNPSCQNSDIHQGREIGTTSRISQKKFIGLDIFLYADPWVYFKQCQ